MNSRNKSDNAQRGSSSFNNHEFDFGLGSGFARSSASGSLNAHKHQNAAAQNAYGGGEGASWAQKPASTSSSSPSWRLSSTSSSSSSSSAAWQGSSTGSSLHAAPRSMVGDITGKSWGAMDNISKGSSVKPAIVGGLSRGASPDLFGDLLGASRSYAPSVNNKPQQQASQGQKSSAFSNLDAMAASLPRGMPMKDVRVSKPYQTEEMGDFVSADSARKANSEEAGWAAFEALSSSKPPSRYSDPAKMPRRPSQNSSKEDPFGDFQSVASAKATAPLAGNANADPFAASRVSKSFSSSSDDFFNFASAAPNKVPAPKKADVSSFSNSIDVDPFAFLGASKTATSQPINAPAAESDPFECVMGKIASASSQQKQADPVLEALWGSTKSQPGPPTMQSVADDWGMETGFGGGDHTETTTELDGLPPPPPGVNGSLSKEKGLEFYKQGQFADAIKWLSWAEVLLRQHGESSQMTEVLTCRSSCLKEVGEYKKAVADCSKVIELDHGNTAILLQRALLYESMEKYKLGIADLKEVLKKEPQNRVANNTLARLKKLGD